MHWWEANLLDHQAEEDEITQDLRNAVFFRDGWQCQYCGTENLDVLAVHHVVFRSQGGVHQIDNLVTLCNRHHAAIHKRRLHITRIAHIWYFAHST